jgi:hypothetical protein
MQESFSKNFSDHAGSEKSSLDNDTEGARLSRRTFIRNSAFGAAGAIFALSETDDARGESKQRGVITLDAILFTYMSATIGAVGSSIWTLNNQYANTLRLASVENPGLELRAKVPATEEKIFVGHNARQTKSISVSGGITLRHSGFNGVSIGHGVGGGPAKPSDTRFYGMLKPRLFVHGNSRKLKFRFVDAQAEFSLPVDDLGNEHIEIGQETISSWLRHYVTEKRYLTGPRFKLKASTGLIDAGPQSTLKVSEDGDAGFSEARTAVVTARVIDQMGLSSDSLKETFAIGNHLEITHTSVQEFDTDDVMKMETKLERVTPGVSEVYWDRVFKNFLIIDAGL